MIEVWMAIASIGVVLVRELFRLLREHSRLHFVERLALRARRGAVVAVVDAYGSFEIDSSVTGGKPRRSDDTD